jgi:hypothetical protein
MRKILISAAAAVTALAVAAPAAAQWQQPQYGYGYGYNNNYGHVRSLQIRLNQIERQINRLDSRNILSEREADRLRRQANQLERQIRYAARNGLNQWEFRGLQNRLVHLEQRVRYEARDGNRYGQGYGRGGWDRDRDGLDDRFERDRGTNYDEDRDYD